jgi:hypothetical protein
MFGSEIVAIAVLALGAVAFGAIAIAREVRNRKMDANAIKTMDR